LKQYSTSLRKLKVLGANDAFYNKLLNLNAKTPAILAGVNLFTFSSH